MVRAGLRLQVRQVPLLIRTGTDRHREAMAVAACRSHRAVAAVREGSIMAVVARRPPTMTATVRRGGMEVAAVVGEIVTTTTRTITEIRMTVIIETATDTERADVGGEDGPAAVEAGAILGADQTRTGAGHHGMTGGIAMATTDGGNGPDRGQGLRTIDGGRIRIGTGMDAGHHARAIRIAEAEEDAVAAGVRRTGGRIVIAMKVDDTKSDMSVANKERQRAMRLVGGIAVTMIR